MPKTKTARKAGRAAAVASALSAPPATVTDEEVARRAYDLYLARGGEHGHDLEDWLQAKGELQAKTIIV